MSCTAVLHALVGVTLLVTAAGCSVESGKSGSDADAGATPTPTPGAAGSISCYIDDQFVCEEDTAPTKDVSDELMVRCSSTSGEFKTPMACPAAGFVGKCTFAEGTNTKTRRYYTGVDAAYNQDFCVNTAHGVWSTTF